MWTPSVFSCTTADNYEIIIHTQSSANYYTPSCHYFTALIIIALKNTIIVFFKAFHGWRNTCFLTRNTRVSFRWSAFIHLWSLFMEFTFPPSSLNLPVFFPEFIILLIHISKQYRNYSHNPKVTWIKLEEKKSPTRQKPLLYQVTNISYFTGIET